MKVKELLFHYADQVQELRTDILFNDAVVVKNDAEQYLIQALASMQVAVANFQLAALKCGEADVEEH